MTLIEKLWPLALGLYTLLVAILLFRDARRFDLLLERLDTLERSGFLVKMDKQKQTDAEKKSDEKPFLTQTQKRNALEAKAAQRARERLERPEQT